MPDHAHIDFNSGNYRQRKLLREVLTKVFGTERSLTMFLDEELGTRLRDEVEGGPFKEQVYELIGKFADRGKLNRFMQALLANDEYKDAPSLAQLIVAWASISTVEPPAATIGSAPPTESLERILEGEVSRIRPLAWIGGVASLRRRVCLLRDGKRGVATGILVGRDFVLTPAHVVHHLKANSIDALFDYGIGAEGHALVSVAATPTANIQPEQPPDEARGGYLAGLDYAILALAEPVGDQVLEDGTLRGWFDLSDTRERLREGEQVFMLHHPHAKEMAFSEGVIGPAPDVNSRLRHNCASVPGSSGAAVVDATLRLIGMHEMRGDDWGLAVRADWIARELVKTGFKPSAPPKRASKSAA